MSTSKYGHMGYDLDVPLTEGSSHHQNYSTFILRFRILVGGVDPPNSKLKTAPKSLNNPSVHILYSI